jgi:hypothetical protein
MPRIANDDIGVCACSTCSESVPVRRVKNSEMIYTYCADCKTKCFAQNYILDNAKLNGKPPLEIPQKEDEEMKVNTKIEKIAPVKVAPVSVQKKKVATEVKPEKISKPAGVRSNPMTTGSFFSGLTTLID